MEKGLTIESFNEVLFSALKDDAKKTELLASEIQMAYQMKIEAMEDVIEKLNENMPYHEELQRVNNIDASLEKLAEMLKDAEKQEK